MEIPQVHDINIGAKQKMIPGGPHTTQRISAKSQDVSRQRLNSNYLRSWLFVFLQNILSMYNAQDMDATPQELLNKIQQANMVVIVMDSRFDYDSISSVFAFKYFLESINKKFEVYCDYEIPSKAQTYYDYTFIKQKVHPNNIEYEKDAVVVYLDSGDKSHLAQDKNVALPSNTKILIDHHDDSECFADLNYIDNKATSTTHVIYNLFSALGVEIDEKMANALLLGILTDSGRFQYSKTSSQTLTIAADLMTKGAKMHELIQKDLFNESYENMLYKKLIFNNLVVDFENKVAYTSHTIKEMQDYGLGQMNPEGLLPAADLLKYMKGINFAFCASEIATTPGKFKASLRSHLSNFKVSEIAKALGGGGHAMAASTGVLENAKSIEEVVKVVMETTKALGAKLWA